MVQPWLLPRPDPGEDDDAEASSDDDDDDRNASVPWAGEGYQRTRDAPPDDIWLGVLPQNEAIVEVFQRCELTLRLGMGMFYQGISAREVRAACVLSRVPRKDWPRVTDGVQLMGRVVADIRNAAKAPKGKRAQ